MGHVEGQDVPQDVEPVQLACEACQDVEPAQLACDVLARMRVMQKRTWSKRSCERAYLNSLKMSHSDGWDRVATVD